MPSIEPLIQQIHDSPTRLILAIAGGGSRAISDLLEVPGASRTLLEAVVPYSAPAMVELLGAAPSESCSAATARAMAMAAFVRARRYDASDDRIAGVSCTASLASDRPKHGEHRIHVGLQTAAVTASWSLRLQKERRTRAEEERLAGRLVLNVVAEACGVGDRLKLELLEGEHVEQSRTDAPITWQEVMLGTAESVCLNPTGEPTKVVFPGAFNPLHAGHQRMAEIAGQLLRSPVAMELSLLNVDKPPLDYSEIQRRLAQFAPSQTVYLTRAATFVEKSRLFPEVTFVVGADTMRRIASAQYYRDNPGACQQAAGFIASRGCRFLVFGRLMDGAFLRLADLDLPDSLRLLCSEVPSEAFRDDISSTALRQTEPQGA